MSDIKHYWHRRGNFPAFQFQSAAKDCSFVCAKEELMDVLSGWDGSGKPIFTVDQISFNGFDEESSETFSVQRTALSGIEACDTKGKPYDLAVRCCLLILRHHLSEDIEISSTDSDVNKWYEAQRIVNEHLEWTDEFHLDAVAR